MIYGQFTAHTQNLDRTLFPFFIILFINYSCSRQGLGQEGSGLQWGTALGTLRHLPCPLGLFVGQSAFSQCSPECSPLLGTGIGGGKVLG